MITFFAQLLSVTTQILFVLIAGYCITRIFNTPYTTEIFVACIASVLSIDMLRSFAGMLLNKLYR